MFLSISNRKEEARCSPPLRGWGYCAKAMKISSREVQMVTRLYRAQKQNRPTRLDANTDRGADKVTLSPESQEIQAIKRYLDSLPDVREEKVKALKQAIQAGTYRVSSRQIAEKLVGRLLADKILGRD